MITLIKKYFVYIVTIPTSFCLLYFLLFKLVEARHIQAEKQAFDVQCQEAAHKFTYQFLQNDILGSAETMGQANERIKELIKAPTDKAIKSKLLTTLNSIREKRKANLLYVLNKNGTALITSSEDKNYSIDGKNYKFRPYFQKAIKGQSNVYAAVGVPSMVRGVYYTAPIYATNKPSSNIIGTVTFKIKPRNIINYLKNFRHLCFLVSSSGIIFASSDADFLYKRAFEIPVSKADILKKNRQFPVDFLTNHDLKLRPQKQVDVLNKMYYCIKQNIPLEDSVGQWSLFFLKKGTIQLPAAERNLIFLFTFSIFLISFTIVFAQSRRQIKKIKYQKKLEQEVASYKTTFDSIHEAILTVDINTKKILDANKMAVEMYGYRLDELQEMTVFKLNAADDTSDSTTGKFIGAADGKSNYIEWNCKCRDGSTFWASVGINFSFEKKHKLIFLSIRNIEKQKEAERMLMAHQEQLEALNKELQLNEARLLQSEKMASTGQLAAGVAHEINNPLSFVHSNLESMKSYSEVFRRVLEEYAVLEKKLQNNLPGLSSEIQQLVVKVDEVKKENKLDFVMGDLESLISDSESGINRVKEIVSNLRQFTQLDNADWERKDINKGIISTIRMISNEFGSNCKIHEKLEPIPKIECNLSELNQAIMNIIQNAIQAQNGEGDIYVKSICENDMIIIKITDTGPGIPEDVLPKIFDPFYTTKEVGKGTGLGLSMTYEIVKKHLGTISVESRPGHTVFTIKLPVN